MKVLSGKRPPKGERDQIRRNEIIDAAAACVVKNGFHAASMAEIAAAARMSVGQIYRYFRSKEAIIHAVVEKIVSARDSRFEDASCGDVAVNMLAALRFANEGPPDEQILMLEVTAEATRNPVVAETVRRARQAMTHRAVEGVLRSRPGLTKKKAASCVEFLAIIVEGTAFRRLGGTEQKRFPYDLYTKLFEDLLRTDPR